MHVDPDDFLLAVRPALQAGDAAALAQLVRKRWTLRELCSLLTSPNVDVRRVVAVTLGLVGDRAVVDCLAKALHDPDEKVNQMAEHGLWSIWFRLGKPQSTPAFRKGVALLSAECYHDALDQFTEVIAIDPEFAEAYNQCAIAHFFVGNWQQSTHNCQQALRRMPMHFGAIAGMGHNYTHLGELDMALKCYRKALAINPRMPAVAGAIRKLEAKLADKRDSSGMFQSIPAPR